ncbi:MAG: hypothetical protein GXO76_06570, partial [Calditrichaeota bacterium]|nr:hypothetical protein [Calditrichota bacterium]
MKYLKHIFFSAFVLLSGALLATNVCARDNRLSAMGNLQLALPDSDNQLNFYDFGQNPAGLQADQTYRWMRIYLNAQNHWGRYRRLYDPDNEQNYSLIFEGVKALNSKETFWG